MSKKILLISGFILADILLGDILILITHNSLLANWGSIIIPSFVMGILWKLLIKDNLKNNFRFVISLILGFTKLVLFLITVQGPALLAAISIPIIYSVVSYIFLILGLKMVPDKNMSNTREQNISK